MIRLVRLASVLLGVASVSYFLVFAHGMLARHEVQPTWSPRMLGATAIAAIAYASVVPMSSWAWGCMLRSMGVPSQILELNMIMGTTQLAKYLPGNVGHYLGRSAMALRRGMPPGALLVTLAAESLLAVAAAGVVGLLGLALHHRTALSSSELPRSSVLAALVAVACVTAGWAAIRWGPALLLRAGARLGGAPGETAPRRDALAAAFMAYAANFVIIGAGLFAVAAAAFGPPRETLPLFIGSLALAWIVGFVVPGAPAGLGVREGAMAALLGPALPPSSALAVIVAFRIATTLGDLLAFAWGGALLLAERRRSAAPGERGNAP